MADRGWMYSGWKRGKSTDEWYVNTKEFLDLAFSKPNVVENGKIKCPCADCRNYVRKNRDDVELDLCFFGFKRNYTVWKEHGEGRVQTTNHVFAEVGEIDRMDNMVADLEACEPRVEEQPIESAKAFYRMVENVKELVHENTTHSTMSAIARLLTIKSMHNLSEACYNAHLELIHELLPPNSSLPKNFYRSKKLLECLGMPYIKIDVCPNNCMLYYKDNEGKEKCDVCKSPRYKPGSKVPYKVLRYLPITDRLQRLYAHLEIAKMMRSHKETPRSKSGVMVHPCDGEAWQHLDAEEPSFASDARNVRVAMATDGFTPYNLGAASYSCWPVFVVPLNLPPEVIMRPEYIFLALVIPGPEHPGANLNVLMQPLVDELAKLWDGVQTWDAHGKQNFNMRAAQLWTIHDAPAFGMVAGWSTHGKLACYDCGCDIESFQLKKGGKACWFDCHRRFLPLDHVFRTQSNAFRKDTVVLHGPPRRLTGEEVYAQVQARVGDTATYNKEHNWKHVSCFWDLPYFKKLLIRHTIDVMHNEKNVAEAIWNTCFDIVDKTKDNDKARLDMQEICDRPNFHLKLKENGKWEKPRAPYCIQVKDKVIILNWFKKLRFPDGYASSFRRGVNLKDKKIFGLKSHDYHIFMERLLPAAFRGFIPEDIWVCLSELSYFYRRLCAKQLSKDTVANLEQNIVVIICKLEKIFPPGFFNSMQHLMIHLPRQARLAGPVQNTWMYRFERSIGKLRKKVRNRSRVEGSITEAHLIEEATNFFSLYFKPYVRSVRNRPTRYDDGATTFESSCDLEMFKHPGRCISYMGLYDLTTEEYNAAFMYILTNLEEMDDFFKQYDTKYWNGRSKPTEKQILELRLKGSRAVNNKCPDFFSWFRTLCQKTPSIQNALRKLSYGFCHVTLNMTYCRDRDMTITRLNHRRRRQPTPEMTNEVVSQENTNNGSPSDNEDVPAIKKKGRTATKLKKPSNGVRIAITPKSDFHFEGDDGIAGQVSALLKLEYPSVIKEQDEAGVETKRHASQWEDYCIVEEPGDGSQDITESAADRFKAEFWSIYKLQNDTPAQRIEADRVLQNLAKKQLKQVLYQARKDAIKKYYNEIADEPITDREACRKELTRSRYIRAKLDWCKDAEAWESLCDYWCSDEYKEKQMLGRHSRTISDDVAQNRGGSRNFIRTKSFIAKTFGPEEATSINTYKLMKVGLKKYKETGSSSCIENPKAKKRLDDYYDGLKEAYPEDWQERDLDPKVIYSTGGGLPHGRLAIGDGAIKKSEVRAIAKQHNIRPANSLSYQDLLRSHQKLEKRCKTVDVVAKHLKLLYAQSGLPVPEDLEDALMGDSDLAATSPSNQGGTPPTGSSHAGGCSSTPQSRGLNATPVHSPNDVDGAT